MRAELARVRAWLCFRELQPTPPSVTSWFLRSSCCDAPVVQGYEREPNLLPVYCAACGRELGAPGREDVDPYETPAWLVFTPNLPTNFQEELERQLSDVKNRNRVIVLGEHVTWTPGPAI